MCGIYGVLSYKDKLKDMNELVDLLGMESAERGTDATGVAYSILGNMKINKSAVSAYKFNPNIPKLHLLIMVYCSMIKNFRRSITLRAKLKQIHLWRCNC